MLTGGILAVAAKRPQDGIAGGPDLRHSFGTQVIGNPRVSIVQRKAWTGYADIDTTMKYLHFAPHAADADLIADAFGSISPEVALSGQAGVAETSS